MPRSADRLRSRPACRGRTWEAEPNANGMVACGGAPPPAAGGCGGRRGMPDGSVPIVIRLGSRCDDVGLARHPAVLAARPSRVVGDAPLLTGAAIGGLGRLGFDLFVVLPDGRLGRERRPHVELFRLVGGGWLAFGIEPRDLAGRRVGPVRQVAGGPGPEADRVGPTRPRRQPRRCSVWARHRRRASRTR